MSGFRGVVLTGASRGLGAELARRFAAPGVRMLLIARSAGALAEVAAECEARGARARTAALDVRDAAALAAVLAAFEAEGPVDLAIANAGTSAGTAPDGTPESGAEAAWQVEVNLLGAMHLIGPLLPGMLARGRGAIGLIASVAAFRGLPDCGGYCASKAGLVAWGEALRAAHGRQGLRVSVICPGFFDSAMGARFLGPRPLAMPLEAAAARIHRALEAGRPRLVFPVVVGWMMRVLALAPPALGDRAVRMMRFSVRPEAGGEGAAPAGPVTRPAPPPGAR